MAKPSNTPKSRNTEEIDYEIFQDELQEWYDMFRKYQDNYPI